MTLATRILTWFRGELVGTDAMGNGYYRRKARGYRGLSERRWVVYADHQREASEIPPVWHAWIHFYTDEIPVSDGMIYGWQKPHLPNLTGTNKAYVPRGHILRGGRRPRATGDYEPWTP